MSNDIEIKYDEQWIVFQSLDKSVWMNHEKTNESADEQIDPNRSAGTSSAAAAMHVVLVVVRRIVVHNLQHHHNTTQYHHQSLKQPSILRVKSTNKWND